MAKARKLKSGSWNCRVMKDGIVKSITVSDPSRNGKRKCEALADEWLLIQDNPTSLTVKSAIENYISGKKESTSPTTILAYKSLQRNAYDDLNDIKIENLTSAIIQKWIDHYKKKHSPKTCANAHGLLISAVSELTDKHFRVKLPQAKEKEYYSPTDKDIQTLINHIRGTEMEKAVLLAAFGTLRRGEIVALKYKDIDKKKNTVTVNKAVVWNGHENVQKAPKTKDSVRTVKLPPAVIKSLTAQNRKPTDNVVDLTLNQITLNFEHVLKSAGLPKFRFHDLRAYSASIRHALGIPDQYIMQDGGWKTDSVLKKVYRRTMQDKRNSFAKISNKHFSDLYKMHND